MKTISYQELKKFINTLSKGNPNNINLDNEDIKIILKNKDLIFIDVCEYRDDNELKSVMQSTNKLKFKNMKSSILLCFQTHPDYNIIKIANIMDIFNMIYDDSEFTIFCTSTNENISKKNITVTMIMTFGKEYVKEKS